MSSGRLARGYRREDGKLVEEKNTPDGIHGAMGGLYSTVRDLGRWASFHLDAWPPRDAPETGPLRRSSVRQMGHAARAVSLDIYSANGSLSLPRGGAATGYGFGLKSLETCELAYGAAPARRSPTGTAATTTPHQLGASGKALRCLSPRSFGARLCYDVAMKKRPGGTMHLSISLPTEEVKLLKRRAKRVYRGNVSRVISDAIRYITYEEGRDALIASFGDKGRPTPEEARQLDREWGISAEKSA